MSTSDTEWQEFIETIRRNQRPYAGYFSWETNRETQELGVVQAFAESLEHQGQTFFTEHKARGVGKDPPDCEATGVDGQRIGIEVTELVDGESIAAARCDEPTEWKPWETNDLLEALQSRISEKDRPSELKGGPYDEYVLVIYCDEPRVLNFSLIEAIRAHTFEWTTLIDRAIFLMSYSPWDGCCPFIELKTSNV